jgi:geranylgeranyl diphosphate synthase type II
MQPFSNYLKEKSEQVNQALNDRIPSETTRPTKLHQAMRYSLFAGGKRFRPILCLASCEACGGDSEQATNAACSLEILHTYTLIHDDLPAMDDDTLRRGKPTCHIAFDEATAILAGDALLTLAFEILSTDSKAGALCAELARSSGSCGVIGGQAEDLAAEGKKASADLVDYIHRNKTAALIRAACVMGAICADASEEMTEQLALYGENIGLAFQLADDLLDEVSTVEDLGKDIGSDRERGKMTYLSVHGAEKTRQDAEQLIREAKQSLTALPAQTEALKNLADMILSKLPPA